MTLGTWPASGESPSAGSTTLDGPESSFLRRRLREPAGFGLLILFLCFDFMRMGDLIPPLGAIRAQLLTVLALTVLWVQSGDRRALRLPETRYLYLYLGVIAASLTYAFNPSRAFDTFYGTAASILVGSCAIPMVLSGRDRLRFLMRIWMLLHLYIACYALTHGGMGPGGFWGDENDTALSLNMAFPLAFLLARETEGGFWKILYGLSFWIMLVGVAFTQSRGGFVGMVVGLSACWYLSANRMRNLAIGVLIAALGAGGALTFLPDTYLDDIKSINDSDDRTRRIRLYYWGIATDMFVDEPVLGVGAGNFSRLANVYHMRVPREERDPYVRQNIWGRECHSLYFTVISELGLIGSIGFFGAFLLLVRRARRTLAAMPRGSDDREIVAVLQGGTAGLLGFAASGAFLSVLYYPEPYYLWGILLGTCMLARPDEFRETPARRGGVVAT